MLGYFKVIICYFNFVQILYRVIAFDNPEPSFHDFEFEARFQGLMENISAEHPFLVSFQHISKKFDK